MTQQLAFQTIREREVKIAKSHREITKIKDLQLNKTDRGKLEEEIIARHLHEICQVLILHEICRALTLGDSKKPFTSSYKNLISIYDLWSAFRARKIINNMRPDVGSQPLVSVAWVRDT